jgi:hypothetical protein
MTAGPRAGPEIGPFIHAMWCKAPFLGRPGLSHSCRHGQAKQSNNTSCLGRTIRYVTVDITTAAGVTSAHRGGPRPMHYLVLVSQTRFLSSRRPSRHLQTLRRLLLLTVPEDAQPSRQLQMASGRQVPSVYW